MVKLAAVLFAVAGVAAFLSAAQVRSEPAAAARAILVEQQADTIQRDTSVGTVTWRAEMVSMGRGSEREPLVRADIVIPQRHLNVTWSLRRNTDRSLPASHTIEIMFNLASDFSPTGGIADVPGVLMKQSEDKSGAPLDGVAVKVISNFFLVGLSAEDRKVEANVRHLKEWGFIDIPIIYASGARAMLTVPKGADGDRAFDAVFAAWDGKQPLPEPPPEESVRPLIK
jgi:hypothetical protein